MESPSSCACAPAAVPAADPENLQVLDVWGAYSDVPQALTRTFVEAALERLRKREQRVARLQTREDWEGYQQGIRRTWRELVGPFPARTPLAAQVVGIVEKREFRIEKLIYESRPGFRVTAALFVPKHLNAPAPGILYCAGHGTPGFRMTSYLTMIQNLVRKGFVVLAFDPVAQGERLQYYQPEVGRSRFDNFSPLEHSYMGVPAFVAGDNLARTMIWDGIRGIDYLVSRPEVDATRLGITGRSGGGTQTSYIAACDDRLIASAPECYITNFRYLLQTRGPQDAEQNFYGGIARGFDHADLLFVRAPKPSLIIATTRDIFSIEGTQNTFAELRRAYAALGHEDNVEITLDDTEHNSTRINREATYAFFQKHLRHPGDPTDLVLEPITPEDVRITPTGQVSTSVGGLTVMDLTRDAANACAARLARRRSGFNHPDRVRRAARRRSGYEAPPENPDAIFCGQYQREGCKVQKYLLPVSRHYAIPLLATVPEQAIPTRTVFYLHPEGKATPSRAGGVCEAMARQGMLVIAPDVSGMGEIAPVGAQIRTPFELNGAYQRWLGFVLLGRSIVGLQASDLIRTVRFAERRFGAKPGEHVGIAHGWTGSILLHAAVLDEAFSSMALIESLPSWRLLLQNPIHRVEQILTAPPAALPDYDLPDLAACLAPRPLLIAGAIDGNAAAVDEAKAAEELKAVRTAYAAAGADSNLTLETAPTDATCRLLEWLSSAEEVGAGSAARDASAGRPVAGVYLESKQNSE